MDLEIREVNGIGNGRRGKLPEDYYRQLGYLLWVPSDVKHILVATSQWLWWPFVHNASEQQFSIVCLNQDWGKKIADATGRCKKVYYFKNALEIMSSSSPQVDLAVIFGPQMGAISDTEDIGSDAYQTLVEKVYEGLKPGGCLFIGVESWLDILMSVTEPRKVFHRFWERRKCSRALKGALSYIQPNEQISLFPVPFLWRPWLLVGASAKAKAAQDAISQVGGKTLTRLIRFLPSRAVFFLFRRFFPARLWIITKSDVAKN